MLTLEQAIRNAVDAERAAQRFYLKLIDRAIDEPTKQFFREMYVQEGQHALAIEEIGKRLVDGDLPVRADHDVTGVETIRGWQSAEDISMLQALELAIAAEQSAALYYDAVADFFSGEAEKFFRDLSTSETRHGEQLAEVLDRLAPNS